MNKSLLIMWAYFNFTMICYAQVGINTDSPKATLDIHPFKTDGSTAEGVIAPHLTGDQLALGDDQYGTDQDGAIVYITSPISDPITKGSPKTGKVTKIGFYYYDAANSTWQQIGASLEPWFSADTNMAATSNTENIYQLGQIGIGSENPDPNAQLDIYSSNKGILIPRLDTEARDKITSPADGLIIFNTSTNCMNYYDAGNTTWLSLCGTFDPANLSIICDPNNGPSGTFIQGTSINSINTYTVVVSASTAGSYTITVGTTNGYSFTKSGTFTTPGKYTVVLEGQGTPVNGSNIYKDKVSLTMNGIDISLATDCLPDIPVKGSSTALVYTCPASPHGEYYKGVALDSSHYIDIPVTSVIATGNLIVETDTQNGIKFSSGSITITNATTNIRLYGQGAPIQTSTGTTYTFSINKDSGGGTSVPCDFTVKVGTSLGNFENPANSCLAILTDNPSSKDGEYWIEGDGNLPIKTFCDMTDGGYTLVWSYSEKTAFSNPAYNRSYLNTSISTITSKLSLTKNAPQQVVTSKTGNISYTNYRLSNTTMKQVRMSSTPNYLVRITENATSMTDPWAKLNYINIRINNPSYDLTLASAEYSQGPEMDIEGKILGAVFTRNGCTKIFNGVRITSGCSGDPALYTNQGDFPNHINWSGQSANFTPIIPGGTADGTTYIPASSNLFGVFKVGWDQSINHFFGKCGGLSGSETSFAIPACADTVPHSSINSGEGRILQWFVK